MEKGTFLRVKGKVYVAILVNVAWLQEALQHHLNTIGNSIGSILLQEGHPIIDESQMLHDQ